MQIYAKINKIKKFFLAQFVAFTQSYKIQIGRASCRERVQISVVAVSLKKKKKKRKKERKKKKKKKQKAHV